MSVRAPFLRRKAAPFLLVAVASLGTFAASSLTPSIGYAQDAGETPISEEAKARFSAGVKLLKDPDGARYDEALREFQAAYAASPSWKILGNLGLSAMKLERNGEALEAYGKYLAQGKGIDENEKKQIQSDMELMTRGSSLVTFILKGATAEARLQDSRVKADGRMAVNMYPLPPNKPVSILMQAGHHVIVAKVNGQELKWETDLTAGKPGDHTFTLEAATATPATSAAPAASSAAPIVAPPPAEEPKGKFPLRTAGYVTGGVGVAVLIGGVVAGAVGKGKLSDLEKECPNKICPPGKKSDADSIESLQTISNVMLIGGVVLAGAGVTMVILDRPRPGKDAPAAVFAPTLRISPAATANGGGLFASGQFLAHVSRLFRARSGGPGVGPPCGRASGENQPAPSHEDARRSTARRSPRRGPRGRPGGWRGARGRSPRRLCGAW